MEFRVVHQQNTNGGANTVPGEETTLMVVGLNIKM